MTPWIILDSARKHGASDEDIVHAYLHPIRIIMFDDLFMFIGPDRAARMLEVGINLSEDYDVIVHAMPARHRFTR